MQNEIDIFSTQHKFTEFAWKEETIKLISKIITGESDANISDEDIRNPTGQSRDLINKISSFDQLFPVLQAKCRSNEELAGEIRYRFRTLINESFIVKRRIRSDDTSLVDPNTNRDTTEAMPEERQGNDRLMSKSDYDRLRTHFNNIRGSIATLEKGLIKCASEKLGTRNLDGFFPQFYQEAFNNFMEATTPKTKEQIKAEKENEEDDEKESELPISKPEKIKTNSKVIELSKHIIENIDIWNNTLNDDLSIPEKTFKDAGINNKSLHQSLDRTLVKYKSTQAKIINLLQARGHTFKESKTIANKLYQELKTKAVYLDKFENKNLKQSTQLINSTYEKIVKAAFSEDKKPNESETQQIINIYQEMFNETQGYFHAALSLSQESKKLKINGKKVDPIEQEIELNNKDTQSIALLILSLNAKLQRSSPTTDSLKKYFEPNILNALGIPKHRYEEFREGLDKIIQNPQSFEVKLEALLAETSWSYDPKDMSADVLKNESYISTKPELTLSRTERKKAQKKLKDIITQTVGQAVAKKAQQLKNIRQLSLISGKPAESASIRSKLLGKDDNRAYQNMKRIILHENKDKIDKIKDEKTPHSEETMHVFNEDKTEMSTYASTMRECMNAAFLYLINNPDVALIELSGPNQIYLAKAFCRQGFYNVKLDEEFKWYSWFVHNVEASEIREFYQFHQNMQTFARIYKNHFKEDLLTTHKDKMASEFIKACLDPDSFWQQVKNSIDPTMNTEKVENLENFLKEGQKSASYIAENCLGQETVATHIYQTMKDFTDNKKEKETQENNQKDKPKPKNKSKIDDNTRKESIKLAVKRTAPFFLGCRNPSWFQAIKKSTSKGLQRLFLPAYLLVNIPKTIESTIKGKSNLKDDIAKKWRSEKSYNDELVEKIVSGLKTALLIQFQEENNIKGDLSSDQRKTFDDQYWKLALEELKTQLKEMNQPGPIQQQELDKGKVQKQPKIDKKEEIELNKEKEEEKVDNDVAPKLGPVNKAVKKDEEKEDINQDNTQQNIDSKTIKFIEQKLIKMDETAKEVFTTKPKVVAKKVVAKNDENKEDIDNNNTISHTR